MLVSEASRRVVAPLSLSGVWSAPPSTVISRCAGDAHNLRGHSDVLRACAPPSLTLAMMDGGEAETSRRRGGRGWPGISGSPRTDSAQRQCFRERTMFQLHPQSGLHKNVLSSLCCRAPRISGSPRTDSAPQSHSISSTHTANGLWNGRCTPPDDAHQAHLERTLIENSTDRNRNWLHREEGGTIPIWSAKKRGKNFTVIPLARLITRSPSRMARGIHLVSKCQQNNSPPQNPPPSPDRRSLLFDFSPLLLGVYVIAVQGLDLSVFGLRFGVQMPAEQ